MVINAHGWTIEEFWTKSNAPEYIYSRSRKRKKNIDEITPSRVFIEKYFKTVKVIKEKIFKKGRLV